VEAAESAEQVGSGTTNGPSVDSVRSGYAAIELEAV
jgi:hypothetical protein